MARIKRRAFYLSIVFYRILHIVDKNVDIIVGKTVNKK